MDVASPLLRQLRCDKGVRGNACQGVPTVVQAAHHRQPRQQRESCNLVASFANGICGIIETLTVCMSVQVFGPRQFPEKLVPKLILLASRDQPLPIHGKGDQERSFIFAGDVADAFDVILHRGRTGEVYNIGTGNERTVLAVAACVCEALGKDPTELIHHVEVRLSHAVFVPQACHRLCVARAIGTNGLASPGPLLPAGTHVKAYLAGPPPPGHTVQHRRLQAAAAGLDP